MRLPRDISGTTWRRCCVVVMGTAPFGKGGSHMTLTLTVGGGTHSVSVPRYRALRVCTLSGIVADVSAHLGLTQDEVRAELFGN